MSALGRLARAAAGTGFAVLIAAGVGPLVAAAESVDPAAVDSTAGTTPLDPSTPRTPQPREHHYYYGGSFALSFWDGDTRIAIQPNFAVAVHPQVAVGLGVSYEFVSYSSGAAQAHNYGGSLFARYAFTPLLYGRAEFELRSLDAVSTPAEVGRETVEFMWLGGGMSTSLGEHSSAYAEVLYDLVQDPLSPYQNGHPLTRVGVTYAY
jgi:hypothetical protein